MAKENKQTDEKIIEQKQQSTPGLYVTAGEIQHSDWDDIDWSTLQKDYVKMIDGCPIISTTLKMLKYPLLNAGFRFECENKTDKSKEAEDYLYWCFDNLDKGYEYFLKHQLKGLDNGLSMFEIVEKRGVKFSRNYQGINSSKITNSIIKISPIKNDTIIRFYYNDIGDFTGIEHERRRPDGANDLIDIDLEDLHYFTFDEEYGDVRGRAILRPVRLYFDAVNKIILAKTNAICKGAGIVGIYTKGTPSTSEKAALEKVARTISSAHNGYFTIDEERARVQIEELKGQQNVDTFVEFLNRMKFYNTMSQFITAGIGQNGSRSATSEHKSTYEIALNTIAKDVERNTQKIADRMIDISYLSNSLSLEEKPKFKFNNITQGDFLKEAEVYKLLYESGLQLGAEDWNIIREKLNLPTKQIEINPSEVLGKEKDAEMAVAKKTHEVELKIKQRQVSLEIQNFENNIIELENANDVFSSTQKRTEEVIDKYYNLFFEDIYNQLSKNRKKDINIRHSIMLELESELSKIYIDGFANGQDDIRKEFAKLNKNKIELALPADEQRDVKSSIGKLVRKLFFNTKTIIENKMDSVSDEFLEKKGGLRNYLLEFEVGFKTDKRAIITDVQSGYGDGRGRELVDLSGKVQQFLY